jgi:hypothetical protein
MFTAERRDYVRNWPLSMNGTKNNAKEIVPMI